VAVQKWFELYGAIDPALGAFAATINSDAYDTSRLVDVATALDAYGKRWHGFKGGSLNGLKHLRDYASVPARTTGSTVRNLKMLVAARNFYAHYNDKGVYGLAAGDVQAELLETIRRGTALMQACLLRDLASMLQTQRTSLIGITRDGRSLRSGPGRNRAATVRRTGHPATRARQHRLNVQRSIGDRIEPVPAVNRAILAPSGPVGPARLSTRLVDVA
jgi:hypothetical protein